MSELLPCPFCGGDAEASEESCAFRPHVICDDCGSSSGYRDFTSEAIAAWNRRALPEGYVMVRRETLETLQEATTYSCAMADKVVDCYLIADRAAAAREAVEILVAATGERDGVLHNEYPRGA